MLVVDASCLFEVVADTAGAEAVRARLSSDSDHVAPHVIDVEVLNVIRWAYMLGHLDGTAAAQAIEDLAAWPGERFGHRSLLSRAWELRDNVRGWDAVYVALAEVLEAPLVTLDRRLATARGPRCVIEVLDGD
jgi:predicted nucleic acid-binding protein